MFLSKVQTTNNGTLDKTNLAKKLFTLCAFSVETQIHACKIVGLMFFLIGCGLFSSESRKKGGKRKAKEKKLRQRRTGERERGKKTN